VSDVDIDQVLIPHPRLAPDVVDELAAAERHPGPFGEYRQQVELGAGQRDRLAVEPHVAAQHINGQVAEGEVAVLIFGVARCPGTTHHRLDAGHQLAGTERLRDVVVGADGQADEGVHLLAPGGQHHDVRVAERADLPAHLDPVQGWQAQVQDDHVGVHVAGGEDRLQSVVTERRLEPVSFQIAPQNSGEVGFVLDHKSPQPGGRPGGTRGRTRSRGVPDVTVHTAHRDRPRAPSRASRRVWPSFFSEPSPNPDPTPRVRG
jgi:hypothetical protein